MSRARTKAKIAKRDGEGCKYCGKTDVFLTVDHVVAGADGGANNIGNMQLLCEDCHKQKTCMEHKKRKGRFWVNPWRRGYDFYFPKTRGVSG